MSLFNKRETLTQNITYMGLMIAINVVAITLMTYVLPILFIPFVLIMPMTSTVVTLFCDKRYFLLYMFATIGICLLVTLNNITDTLFYVIPSTITGFIFGVIIEKRSSSVLAILFASLINVGLTYSFIPMINLIYGQDMFYVVSSIFGLSNYQYLPFVIPSFILTLSIIQETISYALIINELPKMGIKNDESEWENLSIYLGLFASFMSLISYLFFPTFSYFFMLIALFFAVYEVFIIGYNKNWKALIIDGIIVLIFIVLFALVYQYISKPYPLLLLNVLFDGFLIVSLVNNSLTKRTKSVE